MWDTPRWALALIAGGLGVFVTLLPIPLSRGVLSEAPRPVAATTTLSPPKDLLQTHALPPRHSTRSEATHTDLTHTDEAREAAAAPVSKRFAGAAGSGSTSSRSIRTPSSPARPAVTSNPTKTVSPELTTPPRRADAAVGVGDAAAHD
jgi:hypothetical protein